MMKIRRKTHPPKRKIDHRTTLIRARTPILVALPVASNGKKNVVNDMATSQEGHATALVLAAANDT